MKDNGLQSIAVEAGNLKQSVGIFQIIGMIIFVAPIIIHGFKWGWIYPVLALFVVLPWTFSLSDVLGVILTIPVLAGSTWLTVKRVRIMKERRRLENEYIADLHTPTGMRDYD